MNNIKALVNEDLNKVEKFLQNFVQTDNEILQNVSIFINNKSKRIRSIFCLLYLKALNKEINNNIINLILATELIHNASLLHDDVIDESEYRRGHNTLFSIYGSKISILCGDYILSEAVKKLLSINNLRILNIFLDATKKMSTAEVNQYMNRNKSELTQEQYLNVANGKTASLFSACLKSAAILSDIDDKNADKIGELFGIIFQINNDLQPDSLKNDKENGVNTIVNIIGIEKTLDLKDNYKKDLKKYLVNVPINKYKQGIEDLIELL